MINKKNIPLFIGFAVPILMILLVAVSIYLPGLFVHPKYDFLYSTGEDYYSNQSYTVINRRLVDNYTPQTYPNYNQRAVRQLYIHDVETNESRSVTFHEASDLVLDPNIQSPDGFEIQNGSSGGGFFPFWYAGDRNASYLTGHNLSKKLNVTKQSQNYYSPIRFIGWVTE
jgi:hypothetical protein